MRITRLPLQGMNELKKKSTRTWEATSVAFNLKEPRFNSKELRIPIFQKPLVALNAGKTR